MVTIAMLAATAAATAWAGESCTVPMSDWQPRPVVEAFAEAQGWDIRRLHVDDGCYEIDGWDRNGRDVEIMLDPATLAVVEIDQDDGNGNPLRAGNLKEQTE